MGNEASAPAPVPPPSADEPPVLACFGETESEKQAKDRRLMQILGTPPPRRKKGLKQQPGDPKSSAEYFVNEVTFRKKTLGTIFDCYSQGSTELTFDQAKQLVQDLEETDYRGHSGKSMGASEAPDIADDEMYYILEKLGGEMHGSDLRRSTVPRRSFVESMFQAMNLKTYSERHFDRVAIVLSIKGEHAASASAEKGADVALTKFCLLHIWDAFDWNGAGHMNRGEFGAFALKAFGDGDEEVCDTMFMTILGLTSDEEMHFHAGMRIHDFIAWLWDTLKDEPPDSQRDVLEQFIELAQEQPGANVALLKCLLPPIDVTAGARDAE